MEKYLTFVIVMGGWIVSVCLHEFAHAIVAYRGGDTSVRDKGYLTMNPLKYTDPMFSFVLPIIFLLSGGIGLPGAAVYIQRESLRSRGWATAVSVAGPLANLLIALVLGLILLVPSVRESAVGPALSFLGLLQVTAVVFNLLPIPPLDGFGAIEPYLGRDLRRSILPFQQYVFIGLLFVMWTVPVVSASFWMTAFTISRIFGIQPEDVALGYRLFKFWTI